ncbi:MAG: hypothetical protein O3B01_18100 [Planctomycetota bacterium]|nr:hypothetical protein [Planctomycetota bacterium]MDA1140487.1 hypothetical protein [Planctomycetota bacterium]
MKIQDEILSPVHQFVDKYRTRCLWFLREDFYPTTEDQVSRVLKYIEKNGDRAAFIEVAEIKQWLLRNSKEQSAV